DARRAVLQLHDPDDEGIFLYAVDLDADVVMVARNEGHSHVIPKVDIASLETVGLKEFGRGLELQFTPQGQFKTILGRRCELYITSERFLHYFLIPKDGVVNPVFDMKNWMVQRIGQTFKDLMFFGVADQPMPMAVMGTTLTSYVPGKARPPVVDLSNYRVRDERLRDRRRSRDYDPPDEQEMREVDIMLDEMVEEPVVVQESLGSSGDGHGGYNRISPLEPAIDSLMRATTNSFIGTAKLRFSTTQGDKTTSWTVLYASTADRMVIQGRDEQPGNNEHTYATVIDRHAATETNHLLEDDTVRSQTRPLDHRFASPFPPATRDSLVTGTRKLLGRTTQHRLLETEERRRESWVDVKTPSLFHDVLGARKSWGGVEVLLRGPMVTSTRPGMPLEVEYRYGTDTMHMRVLELRSGAVDPKLFLITKSSWNW
ncbi:MAG: hypothetical protein M3R08_07890, partial [Bacteroidota bacterium]|nr:hypothetical protein [Bacteroidota bacterium]